jgi:hypothetical protein
MGPLWGAFARLPSVYARLARLCILPRVYFQGLAFAQVTSDAEIAALIDECFRRGGFDQDAMKRWEARVREVSEGKNWPTAAPWVR